MTSAMSRSKTKWFVAITVIGDDDDGYIVPSIFVCNSHVKTRLKELHLSAPSNGLGRRIEALLKEAKLHTAFSVFEDRSTVPDDVRIFVGYKSPPQGFVSLETFVKGAIANEADVASHKG